MTDHEFFALIQKIAAQRRTPGATYRLQLNHDFTFHDAAALVDYWHELGITDCYASPIFRARAQSTHGYDVCDFNELNPVLGGESGFQLFSSALRKRGMGLIADMVPNHMGVGDPANRWWTDVLETGPCSFFAPYFDIDWEPADSAFKNKVVLPVLGDHYEAILEGGGLRLMFEAGSLFVTDCERRFPLSAESYAVILAEVLRPPADESAAPPRPGMRELEGILRGLRAITEEITREPEKSAARSKAFAAAKRQLAELHRTSLEFQAALDATLREWDGRSHRPDGFLRLDALLRRQHYRLAFWKDGFREINYRRFFDVSDLAALRMEHSDVFRACHQLVLQLLEEGKVTGLRIDHPDGLWDPEVYFHRLQESYLVRAIAAAVGDRTDPEELNRLVREWVTTQRRFAHTAQPAWPLFVVAEKILSGNEPLARGWAVDGTTGYDFLNAVNGLFVDPDSERAFDELYGNFSGRWQPYGEIVRQSKRLILQTLLASDLNLLTHRLRRIASGFPRSRDFTFPEMRAALAEVVVSFPVYRTYFTDRTTAAASEQTQYVEEAVANARSNNPQLEPKLFEFIRDVLLRRNWDGTNDDAKKAIADFIGRFQQRTGPVMAKGCEDTAFYVYNRLVSLNEVGGQPEKFGRGVAEFHQDNKRRAERWPNSFLATSTHDTKRGEDARARLNALSEMPDEWRDALARWSRLNAQRKRIIQGQPAPDPNDECLLYQNLLAAWPAEAVGTDALPKFRDRMMAYLLKAIREAKVHTSWLHPDREYEEALENFVQQLLDPSEGNLFLSDFLAFQRQVGYYGQFNSLSQVLLKIASPGVPDFYQGSELWDLSLVDPDNRRPVDFQMRRRLLADLEKRESENDAKIRDLLGKLLDENASGQAKLFLIHAGLNLRRDRQELFARGEYRELFASGPNQQHVCAFARVLGNQEVIVVVPRLVVSLTDRANRPPMGEEVWRDTKLLLHPNDHGQIFRNVLTGEKLNSNVAPDPPSLMMKDVLNSFPTALLDRVAQ